MKLTLNRRAQNAFSLIEVTISMAIVAVAVVSLLGMLPRGMQTMQKAGDQAIFGRINQQILSELQLTTWDAGAADNVETFDGETRYYDSQGIEVEPSEDREQVYAARIHVPGFAGGKRPEALGGGQFPSVELDPNTGPSEDVRTVVVEVAADSRPDFDFDVSVNKNLINVFQTTLSRQGRDYDKN